MNPVEKTIDALVESGVESGVQIAVYRRGELVVDATAGGLAPSAPVYSASTGKAVTLTVVHVLVRLLTPEQLREVTSPVAALTTPS
ncbi:serine hydrolase [Nonomuraea sp. NPDC049152]|uniref:serine hydrolase n=1 Tax=Nonomuraea sp. NPDC049152 TaxID=3154350 RepID=UPI00340F2375